jgi:2-keto-4-pentenoate hydratase/2-oxohepta-3-ene-1,7-dioic acid hydratase in catechol pathway
LNRGVRLARRRAADGGSVYGIVGASGACDDNDALTWTTLDAPFWAGGRAAGDPEPLNVQALLAPVAPSKIVGFGRNYAGAGRPEGHEPSMFVKPPTTVIGPTATVVLPRCVDGVLYEAELAVVIGRRCRNVTLDESGDVVLGFCCANDVTAVGLPPAAGGYPVKAKSFDTFCPLGPWVETDVVGSDLAFGARVNGEERQLARTSEMLTPALELVVLASEVMTLWAGDVILTGTPPGIARVVAGDVMEVWVEGVGSMSNAIAPAPGCPPS